MSSCNQKMKKKLHRIDSENNHHQIMTRSRPQCFVDKSIGTFGDFQISSSMDRRKTKSAVEDELALAKSAAWAWYQRGSSADCRTIREFEAWRKKIEPKPSRYKLEALRNNRSLSPASSARSSTANSLLDTYEVEKISSLLDYYIEITQNKIQSSSEVETKSDVIKTQRKHKGSWFRRLPYCGSSKHDVIESHRFLIARSTSEKAYSGRHAGQRA